MKLADRVVGEGEGLAADEVVPVPKADVVGDLILRIERRPVVATEEVEDSPLEAARLLEVRRRVDVQGVVPHPERPGDPKVRDPLRKAQHVLPVRGVDEGDEIESGEAYQGLVHRSWRPGDALCVPSQESEPQNGKDDERHRAARRLPSGSSHRGHLLRDLRFTLLRSGQGVYHQRGPARIHHGLGAVRSGT